MQKMGQTLKVTIIEKYNCQGEFPIFVPPFVSLFSISFWREKIRIKKMSNFEGAATSRHNDTQQNDTSILSIRKCPKINSKLMHFLSLSDKVADIR